MDVEVLCLPTCSQCTGTVELLRRLQADYPRLRFERVNIADRPDLAERYGLLSFEYDLLDSHAVTMDGNLVGVGHPSEDTLRSWLDRAAG